jgi:hypothetical protein
MNSFEENIKTWVSLDNETKILKERLKELRTKKNGILDNINYYVDTQSLENAVVNISDGQLKFIKTNSTQGLTLGFLEDCLFDIYKNKEQTQKVLDYIKSKREIKTNSDIRRFYN